MNPLNRIHEWYVGLEDEIQYELVILTGMFHPDEQVNSTLNKEERMQYFIDYLDSSQLDPKEVVKRSMWISRLIFFGISGRDTKQGWRDSIDKNLDIRNRMEEQGADPSFIDKALSGFTQRQEKWLTICERWNNLVETELTDNKLSAWYDNQTFTNM